MTYGNMENITSKTSKAHNIWIHGKYDIYNHQIGCNTQNDKQIHIANLPSR